VKPNPNHERRIFSRGETRGIFQNVCRWLKVVKLFFPGN